MKVIVGISYKGGQGRTMTLANMGACLYRLGYNVALIDFDLDAPDLPWKFGCSPYDKGFKGKGIVKYFWDSFKIREAKENIEDYCIQITPTTSPGRLILLPTGYTGINSNYLQDISSWEWLTLMDSLSNTDKKIGYFKGLLHAIGMLEPEPDYLLIDTKAGINDISAISMIFWAEKILCFFGNESGNLEGTQHILKNADRLPDKRKELGLTMERGVKILPILSRIPHFLSKKQRDDLQKKTLKDIEAKNLKNWSNKIFMLHSDPDLEVEPHLVIPLEGEIKRTQLLNEYLELIAAACSEIATKKKQGQTNLDYLWKELKLSGEPGEIDETYRVFKLKNTQGIMINLSDNQRNVSFKVETFCGILNDIHKGLIEKTEYVDKDFKKSEQNFYHAGSIAGKNFGKSFIEKVLDTPGIMTVEEKLDEWCHFDSDIGFGHMERKELEKDESGDVVSGKIVVRDNFLAKDREKDEANLCCLFAGYIAGALDQILGFEVEISHPQSLCMRLNTHRKSCEFIFCRKNVKKKPTGWEESCV